MQSLQSGWKAGDFTWATVLWRVNGFRCTWNVKKKKIYKKGKGESVECKNVQKEETHTYMAEYKFNKLITNNIRNSSISY